MDLMTLAAKITLDTGEYTQGVKGVEKSGKELAGKLSAKTIALGNMMGNFATSAIKKVGEVAVNIFQKSYKAFADYEQLVGGIDTLFKKELDPNAYNLVMQNAEKAFKTAGMSANQYMETVTAFSASLIQSLGGDTYKAAEVADMAIQDMADNANKMGTDMASVENAYKGFAKQNYTMLDNLKLGYGGTRGEMERLLKDAEKITKKKYNINNLADVYEAIHEIQKQLGVTGATAAEADKTVEGSTKMMKASWENLLIAISSGKNVKKATKDFTNSLKTMAKNAVPVIKNIASGLGEAIRSINWGDVLKTGWDIIDSFGRGLFGKNWDITVNWVKGATEDVTKFIESIPKAINIMVNFVIGFTRKIGEGIGGALIGGEKGGEIGGKIWDLILAEMGIGHAKGAWSIPYDNYPALLHRNERVLTASQARQQDSNAIGNTSEIVGALESVRNDLQNMQLIVGRKPFGRAVVDYGGSRVSNYIGRSDSRLAAGYGA